MTAFTVVFVAALVAVAGLVHDGGRVLAARAAAFDTAEAAARAGAQAVDLTALRNQGVMVLDQDEARQRAEAYLVRAGQRGTVAVDGDTVRVRLRAEEPLDLLSLFGLGPLTLEGTGEAHAVASTQEEP